MAKCTRKPLTAQAVEETMEAHRAAPGLHPSPLTRGVHGHALCPLREPDAARAVHPQAGAGLGRGADGAAAVQAVDGRGAGARGGGDSGSVSTSVVEEIGGEGLRHLTTTVLGAVDNTNYHCLFGNL